MEVLKLTIQRRRDKEVCSVDKPSRLFGQVSSPANHTLYNCYPRGGNPHTQILSLAKKVKNWGHKVPAQRVFPLVKRLRLRGAASVAPSAGLVGPRVHRVVQLPLPQQLAARSAQVPWHFPRAESWFLRGRVRNDRQHSLSRVRGSAPQRNTLALLAGGQSLNVRSWLRRHNVAQKDIPRAMGCANIRAMV